MYTHKLIFALLMFGCCLKLQAQENLQEDSVFFKKQVVLYQKWLDHSGIGNVLKTHLLTVKDDVVELYLSFNYVDADSASAAWSLLKSRFEKRSDLPLERQLLYKMLQIMDLPNNNANVQIFDNYNPDKKPCLYVGIYYEGDRLKIDTSFCKYKERELSITPANLSGLKKTSYTKFKQLYSKEIIFNKIYNYSKNKYEGMNALYAKNGCENRGPKVSLKENGENLRFEVYDLCKEVLSEETQPDVCAWLRKLSYPCNWIKRERLTFTFTFRETEEGIRIGCIIDGKFGSGYYDDVKRGGYLDMEIDFDSYLTDYADRFREEIRTLITN